MQLECSVESTASSYIILLVAVSYPLPWIDSDGRSSGLAAKPAPASAKSLSWAVVRPQTSEAVSTHPFLVVDCTHVACDPRRTDIASANAVQHPQTWRISKDWFVPRPRISTDCQIGTCPSDMWGCLADLTLAATARLGQHAVLELGTQLAKQLILPRIPSSLRDSEDAVRRCFWD